MSDSDEKKTDAPEDDKSSPGGGKPPQSVADVQRELQDFIRDKFGGDVVTFPVGSNPFGDSPFGDQVSGAGSDGAGSDGAGSDGAGSDGTAEDSAADEDELELPSDVLSFDMTPRQVKAYLDRYVIGQDDAKRTLSVAICDHYNHVRRSVGEQRAVVEGEKASDAGSEGSPVGAPGSPGIVEYVKQNVILLGPTGVGKTYLVRILAQLIGVPFVKADVTKFSETGYVGGDVDDLVRELVRAADGNARLASHGIIFLDEIDKIASAQNANGRDPSGRGVQVGLLKLMEETEVGLRNPMDFSAQFQDMFQSRGGKGGGASTINTKHILFVVSGAFSGIDEIIEKRLSERNVGFAAALASAGDGATTNSALLANATTKDFVDFGFEPEFIGRLPVRVALDELEADDLYRILTTSEGSILRQYRQNFADYGIEIAFDEKALRDVALLAAEEKTGARGLMSVLERSLREFKFYLPGGSVKRLAMTPEIVANPKGALDRLKGDAQTAESEYWRAVVREFEFAFARRHGVKLDLDDDSVGMAVTLAGETGVTVNEYLWSTFEEHVDFLRRICEDSGRTELPVTPQVLSKPGSGVDVWLAQ